MKGLAILGSTGSIGTNTLEVVKANPKLFNIHALTCYSKIDELIKQIDLFNPKKVVVCDPAVYDDIKNILMRSETQVLYGEEGLLEVVSDPEVQLVVNALVGFSGLRPTLEAIKHYKDIAIANKETIVVAGELVLKQAKKNNVSVIPIDSEHNALLLLLRRYKKEEIRKVILTASGGPFRTMTQKELLSVTLDQALNHPTWKMGKKITIDSSTLMNKGFEVIEAHHLFGFDYQDIEVVIHKESIIHSMIETIDGEIYAQMGPADMKFPIQNALTYPEIHGNSYPKMKLWEIGSLSFDQPDYDRFPLLKTAYRAGKEGGTLPAVLNASNEEAVYAFLDSKIGYMDIHSVIDQCLDAHQKVDSPEIKEIYQADHWARDFSKDMIVSLS